MCRPLFLTLALAAGWSLQRLQAQVVPEVWIDANAVAARNALPFDKPFLFIGKAAPELQQVVIRVGDLDQRGPRDPSKTLTACGAGRSYHWLRRLGTPASADTFRVLVTDPLRPNRNYAVCMELTSGIVKTAADPFREAATAIVTRELRAASKDERGVITPELERKLRDLLQAAVGDSVRLAGPAQSAPITLGDLKKAIEFLDRRDDAVADLKTSLPPGTDKLKALRDDATLTLLHRVGLFPAAYKPIGDIIASLESDSGSLLAQFISGQVALEEAETGALPRDVRPGDLWDAAEVEARLTRLASTETGLRKTALFMLQLSKDPGLLKDLGLAGKVTNAQAIALQGRFKAMADELVGIRGSFTTMKDGIEGSNREIQRRVDDLTFRVTYQIDVLATTVGDFKTRAGWYLAADFGLAYIPQFDDVHPYAGVNIYFSPVDKSVPISRLPYSRLEKALRLCSVMMGITLKGVAKEKERENLAFGQGLVFGAGCRLTDAVRTSVGEVIFRVADPNRLKADPHLASSFFVSISLDADLKPLLGKVGDALF